MKSKEQQIEEIKSIICNESNIGKCKHCIVSSECGEVLERLYAADYRKQSDTVREFVTRFKQKFFFMMTTSIDSPIYQCTGKEIEKLAAEFGVELDDEKL